MTNKKDYYESLGIRRDADAASIKKAYRKLAKKYHPDSNEGNARAAERFKEITEAYNILSDPEKRKLYDQFGHAAFDGTGAAYEDIKNHHRNAGFDGFSGFHEGSWSGSGPSWQFSGSVHEDPEDLFRNLFGHDYGSSSTGTGFGRGFFRDFHPYGHMENEPVRGKDLRTETSITFEEAVFGCKKRIRLTDPVSQQTRTLEVNIPAGIEDGRSIRLKGSGLPGQAGAEAGDLLIEIHVGTKKGFERKGQDIFTTIQIPFTTAVLGGEVIVPTLYGDVSCSIKQGTQSGTSLRLRGKGVPSATDPSSRGDQYVSIEIQVPRHLSAEAVRRLRAFEQALNSTHSSVA